MFWRLVETATYLLKDFERRTGAFVNNVGEVFGAAIASFSGLLIAEMLRIADLEEGNG